MYEYFVLAAKCLLVLLAFLAVGAGGIWYCLHTSNKLVDNLFGRNSE